MRRLRTVAVLALAAALTLTGCRTGKATGNSTPANTGAAMTVVDHSGPFTAEVHGKCRSASDVLTVTVSHMPSNALYGTTVVSKSEYSPGQPPVVGSREGQTTNPDGTATATLACGPGDLYLVVVAQDKGRTLWATFGLPDSVKLQPAAPDTTK